MKNPRSNGKHCLKMSPCLASHVNVVCVGMVGLTGATLGQEQGLSYIGGLTRWLHLLSL